MSLAKFAPTPDVGRLACLLERLVAIDTQNPLGREADAPALLASELDAIGFVTEGRPIAEGRANVVARIDNGAGTCFAFNSHTDTVPVGGGWTSDPFRLTDPRRQALRAATRGDGRPWSESIPWRYRRLARSMARHARVDVRCRRGNRRRLLKGARKATYPRQRQGNAFWPSGSEREFDPRCRPSHVPVRRTRSRIECPKPSAGGSR